MPTKYCCFNCFNDLFIQQFIEYFDIKGNCSYCQSKNVYIADIYEVGAFIMEGIFRKYEDAANSVAFCSQDGGYQLSTLDIDDILIKEEEIFGDSIDDPTELTYDLINPDGTPYVRQDPYGPVELGSEIFQTWQSFCDLIKSKQRFTALSPFTFITSELTEKFKPNEFLENLLSYLEIEFVSKVPAKTIIHRGRLGEYSKHKDLTSPPINKTKNNRMSPKGISIFYGSMDIKTAIYEVRPSLSEIVTVGKFVLEKDLNIIDLSRNFDKYQSIFDGDYSIEYERILNFLSDFVRDIAKPIRASDADIEYLPTQALTEYIRYNPKTYIDGIKFISCMRKGGVNIVLFKGQDISYKTKDPWLKYLRKSKYKIDEVNLKPKEVK